MKERSRRDWRRRNKEKRKENTEKIMGKVKVKLSPCLAN
jgi:hypothetical protein